MLVTSGRFKQQVGARRGRAARLGFSMIEVTACMALMVIGIGAVAQTMVRATALQSFTHERSLALLAAESVLESMRGEVFSEVFARYNQTTADDLAGNNPGANFAVLGLTPIPGDADGMAGSIELPGNGTQLFEWIVDADMGMPRDLNSDGQPPDLLDHAGDYTVLPVRIRVRWNGVRGDSRVVLVTTLNNLRKGP